MKNTIPKRTAIITFDYELFLGRRTGTVENSVLKPTEKVLQILLMNKAKAIFFVDAAWLLVMKEKNVKEFKMVAAQLKEITDAGSSVELHIHPQWFKAAYRNEQFILNSEEVYTIQSLPEDEILTIFLKCTELLSEITGKKPSCFRAGGWCIEPFHKLKESFRKTGIAYDFSVVAGNSIKEGKLYDYDFTKTPRLPFYRFSNTVNEQDKNGLFLEFPLSTYNSNPVYRIINKALLKIENDMIFGDGIGAKEKSFLNRLPGSLSFSKGMLMLDKTSSFLFRYLIKTHFKKSNLLVVVSHPKIISLQSLKNLDFITRRYKTLNAGNLDNFILNN